MVAVLALVGLAPLGARGAVTVESNGSSTTACAGAALNTCAKRAVSGDGSRVVFASDAANLVAGDTNAATDVFLAEVAGGDVTLRRVSAPESGQADGDSATPSISPDGNWVAFESDATNLVAGDTDGRTDVFAYHVPTNRLFRASLSETGAESGSRAHSPSVADDGSVAFESSAGDLVAGVASFSVTNVYVRRDPSGANPSTVLASAGDFGGAADADALDPTIDGSGTRVAFVSEASNLGGADLPGADVFVRDLAAPGATRITTGASASTPSISPDGDEVAFVAGGDGHVAAVAGGGPVALGDCAGCAAIPSLSAGGATVFTSSAPPAGAGHQVWLKAPPARLVSVGANGRSGAASISADGNFVAFTSEASNLVAGDTNDAADVFLADVRPGGAVLRLTGPGPATTATTPPTGPAPTAAPTVPATPDPGNAIIPAGPGRSGYWMLDDEGIVYAFGDAKTLGDPSADLGHTAATDLEPTPSGRGYWIVDRRGRVFSFGDADPTLGNVERKNLTVDEKVTSLSATPTGKGYWVFTTSGRVLAMGDARHLGDMAGTTLNGPVLDSIPTPSGRGYYMVASDGGIFAFGDAAFRGSMGDKKLNAPVQSLVPDGDNDGYWLVASDGGIFAFSAPFKGSMGATPLNKPVTGMVRYGDGYLMVGEDGGIFNFSTLPFLGSLGADPPKDPIVSVAPLS